MSAIAGHVPLEMTQAISSFLDVCYNFRRLRQSLTVVVSKVRSQMSLEECKSWTCIVLLGLRTKVQVEIVLLKTSWRIVYKTVHYIYYTNVEVL